MAEMQSKAEVRAAQKGMIGKWPNCREPDKPDLAAKPCPEGHVRKGKKCVELTKDDGGKKPPRVVKAENADQVPPAIAALVTNGPHRRGKFWFWSMRPGRARSPRGWPANTMSPPIPA